MSKFYCGNHCFDTPKHRLQAYNEHFDFVVSEDLSLDALEYRPKICCEQCFDCIAIVGKRRIETKNILDHENKNNKPMSKLEEKSFNIIGLYMSQISKDIEIKRDTKLVLLSDAQQYADEKCIEFTEFVENQKFKDAMLNKGIVRTKNQLLELWKQKK